MNHEQFPAGTPVCVRQTIERRGTATFAEVIGVVQAWEQQPTGSWFAAGPRNSKGDRPQRLWLQRLKIKKADGEIVLLIVDDGTAIAKLESAPSSGGA